MSVAGFSIPQESVCCALCGQDESAVRFRVPLQTKIWSGVWINGERQEIAETATIVRCTHCGLHYVNPRWVLSAEMSAYTAEHEKEYFASTYAIRRHTYGQLIAQLPEWLGRTPHNLLDIGCGDGVLLEAAQASGLACAGTELSAPLRQLVTAKSGGQLAVYATLDALPDPLYDVVTLINVIEHVQTPQALLADLATKLTPGGILLIHTPNFGGLPARIQGARWAQIEPLEHLYYFSATTLGAMVRQVGLEPVGRFHLAVGGPLKRFSQSLLGRLGIFLDNGLGLIARRTP